MPTAIVARTTTQQPITVGNVSPGVPSLAPVAGGYYDNSDRAVASATLATGAHQLTLALFWPTRSILIDNIGVSVATATAGAQFRIIVYGAGADGWPSDKLYESSDLSAALTGYVGANPAPFGGFVAGSGYWLGLLASANFVIRALPQGSTAPLGLANGVGTSYNSVLRKAVQYGANMAPARWVYVDSERQPVTPPSIRFRAAVQ